MANEKISQLPTVTNAAVGTPSIIPIVDSVDTTTKSIALTQLDLRWQGKFAAQTANTLYAGPASGSSAVPSFRSLSGSDYSAASFSSKGIVNLGIKTLVNSGILQVTVTQNDSVTSPAPASPTVISFRSSILGQGLYNTRTLTTSINVDTSAIGCTLGLASGINQTIYVYMIDVSSSIQELALAGSSNFSEDNLYSTTVIGSGSTSSDVLYSHTARTNVPIRLIGTLVSNQATSGTYNNVPVNIAMQVGSSGSSAAGPRSEVFVSGSTNTGGGNGSTNTAIRIFINVQINIGSAITYATSVTLGDSFTINETGVYSVTYCYGNTNTQQTFGASVNSTQLSGNINSINIANFIACSFSTNQIGNISSMSASLNCTAGDIIRPHGDGSPNGSTTDNAANFRVVKVSN